MAETTIVEETLAYWNPLDDTGPLYLFAAYPLLERPLPVLVVMHGYSEGADRMTVAPVVRRFARRHGLLAVSVDMRGRGGSAGRRDSGGREVSDIWAAVEFLRTHFRHRMDPENLGILGYSGGGGNVFSVLVKCPDLFRCAFSFFGISDYAYWFDHGALGRHRAQLVADIGGHPGEFPERYAARNSLLGVGNNPYTDIHLFWDAEEEVCPAYFNRAYAERAHRLGFDNVTLHESRPGDRYRWHHGYPEDSSDLVTVEPFIAEALLDPLVPPVAADVVGRMTVVGYLITRPFIITLGELTDSVAEVDYRIAGRVWSFRFTPQSAPPGTRAAIILRRWPHRPGIPARAPGLPRVFVRRPGDAEEVLWPEVRRERDQVTIAGVPLDAEVVVEEPHLVSRPGGTPPTGPQGEDPGEAQGEP